MSTDEINVELARVHQDRESFAIALAANQARLNATLAAINKTDDARIKEDLGYDYRCVLAAIEFGRRTVEMYDHKRERMLEEIRLLSS